MSVNSSNNSNIKKNNVRKKINKKAFYIFLGVFFVSLIALIAIISNISPDVDVQIGNSHSAEQSDGENKSEIDDRLRWLQLEDNMPGVSRRVTVDDTLEEEPVYLKKNEKVEAYKKTDIEKEVVRDVEYKEVQLETNKKLTDNPQSIAKTAPAKPAIDVDDTRISRVYIGQFSSVEQAIAMQNRLVDSDLNVTPFVKNINGTYVLQVGSFASRQKAQTLVTQLEMAGYFARIVQE